MIDDDDTLRDRVTRSGEEALGRLAQELLDNKLISSALTTAFDARERAVRAQEVAMGALNLPSAADLERLTRRVRNVSQRLEGIEDGLDRLDDRLERPSAATRGLDERLARIEALLARLEAERAAAPATAEARPATRRTGARSGSSGADSSKSGSARSGGPKSTARRAPTN